MRLPHLLLVLLPQLLGVGCSSLPTWNDSYSQGALVVLPPKNVVQDGKAHEAGAGSGELLAETVRERLVARGWSVEVAGGVAPVAGVDAAAAIAAAGGRAAEYALVLELGEFRDAAPFSFRADFVTLQSGVMYRVASGEPVWRLEKPVVWQASNLGSYRTLVKEFGAAIAASIADHVGG